MTTTPPTDTHEGPKLGRNQIQTFVLALDKALRAQRLYGGRESGFVAKLLDNLERELSELLAQGAVRLGVGSVGFTHEGRPLFTTAVDDIQLPWAFRLFCDGIREISFEQTMRWGELLDFLDILSTNPRMSEEDLVTMLWERDFDGIRYYAADTFAAGLEVDENGELVISAKKNLESDQGEQLEEFALSPDDIRLLSGEDHLAWLQRTRAPGRSGGAHAFQTARLKSSLQDVADLPRFMDLALEVVTRSRWTEGAGLALLTDQLDAHISRRDIEGFEAYFAALASTSRRGGDRAFTMVSKALEPHRLPSMVPMLVEADEIMADVPDGLLASGAMDACKGLLEVLPSCPFQEVLESALIDAGADLTLLYAERLGSSDAALVSASIQALGRLGSSEAIKALASVLSRPSLRQRREALRAMAGRYNPVAKGALIRALDDQEPTVRVAALHVLRQAHDPEVVRAILPHMRRSDFEKRKLEECAAWFGCLASAEAPSALAYLSELLDRRNLLRNRGVIAHQILAVRALGQLRSSRAHQVLERAYRASHLPRQVKHAIRAAVSTAQEA